MPKDRTGAERARRYRAKYPDRHRHFSKIWKRKNKGEIKVARVLKIPIADARKLLTKEVLS